MFDISALSPLFKNYYRDRFPTLCSLFDKLVEDGDLVSTREAGREVSDSHIQPLLDWYSDNKGVFIRPLQKKACSSQKYIVFLIFNKI